MKFTIFAPLAALLAAGAIARPAPVPSQDPSPAGSLPKYALVEGNPLEKRTPLALSRFPTDNEDEVNDPSPPRPFPAGHPVEANSPSARNVFEPRTARPPLSNTEGIIHPVDPIAKIDDPSPPMPFPAGPPVEATP